MTARVLVVDDIEPNVKLLEAKLRAEYFEVITATSGQQAIDLANEHQPDVILLDVMMPGLDGFQTCEILKASDRTWHIPVVMVTALDQHADRIAGLQAGADDFLTKPVQDIALFARVKSLARFKHMTDELRQRHEAGAEMGVLERVDLTAFDQEPTTYLFFSDDADWPVVEDARKLMPQNVTIHYESDGRRALERIRNGEPDVVFIDLAIESYDPLRLCSSIRAFDASRLAPILAVAQPGQTRLLIRALELGVSDYLLAPASPEELVARSLTQIRWMRYIKQLRQSFDQTMELAITDQLTGLYNRRFLGNQGTRLIDEAHPDDSPLSALMIDIDHFKSVNDTYGHDVGDVVLREVASRLTHSVRGSDLACRTGGEEFAVVMPRTPSAASNDIAGRILRAISSEPVSIGNGKSLDITVSIGAADFGDGDTLASILKRADEALYASKRNGRNQITNAAAA